LATGSVDFLVAVPTLWTLSTVFNIHYLAANLLAMIAPPLIKFYLNEKHIFKPSRP
jgi:putative flippase GtrA